MRKRLLHVSALSFPRHPIHSVERIERREERIRLAVDDPGDFLKIFLRGGVHQSFVPRAVDRYARMRARECDNRLVFLLLHVVRRFYLDYQPEFVGGFEILRRRNERMQTDEIEAEFLALGHHHAVIPDVARDVDGLREIAELRDAAQKNEFAVEA